jgi:hypothetical protein
MAEMDKLKQYAPDTPLWGLWLSGSLRLKREVIAYADYFKRLSMFLTSQIQRINAELIGTQSKSVSHKQEVVAQLLRGIITSTDALWKADSDAN